LGKRQAVGRFHAVVESATTARAGSFCIATLSALPKIVLDSRLFRGILYLLEVSMKKKWWWMCLKCLKVMPLPIAPHSRVSECRQGIAFMKDCEGLGMDDFTRVQDIGGVK
jgi:hypothetical protein